MQIKEINIDGRSMLDYVEKLCFPTRKNHARALDSMQASLEAEARAKAEALRIKKKLETVCLFVCLFVGLFAHLSDFIHLLDLKDVKYRTSMSLRLPWTMPTRPTQRHTRPSSVTRTSTGGKIILLSQTP